MNHREGRFGLQEAASAAGIGALISGVFSMNTAAAYAKGNVNYLATFIGLLLTFLLLLLLVRAMERSGGACLGDMLTLSLGKAAGAAALPISALLLLAAVLPLFRFVLVMNRFIFVESDYVDIVMYFLPVLLVLSILGMETIARVSRLLALPVIVAFLFVFYVASPAYGAYHLYPLLSSGLGELLLQSLQSVFRFLPATLSLAIVGKGCQGVQYVSKCGKTGLLWGGLLSCACQLFLGLTFFASDLAEMSAPFYRLIMAVRYDIVVIRLDVVLLLLWVMTGLVAASFYVYAASLLFVQVFKIGDIRPVSGLSAALVSAAVLLLHFDSEEIAAATEWIYLYAFALLLLPVLLGIFASLVRKRKTA